MIISPARDVKFLPNARKRRHRHSRCSAKPRKTGKCGGPECRGGASSCDKEIIGRVPPPRLACIFENPGNGLAGRPVAPRAIILDRTCHASANSFPIAACDSHCGRMQQSRRIALRLRSRNAPPNRRRERPCRTCTVCVIGPDGKLTHAPPEKLPRSFFPTPNGAG